MSTQNQRNERLLVKNKKKMFEVIVNKKRKSS